MEAMKTSGKDILTSQKELKDIPFKVPEGYFESFKSEMSAKVATKKPGPWKKAAPYMAIAAALALFVALGALLKDSLDATETYSQEDYILFSDNLISTELYEDNMIDQFAEADLMEEDIIQYLIYIGADLESFELEK